MDQLNYPGVIKKSVNRFEEVIFDKLGLLAEVDIEERGLPCERPDHT